MAVAAVDVGGAVELVAARLDAAGCPTPRVDAGLLVGHVLGLTRSEVSVESLRVVTHDDSERIELLTERRERREPLAYVLGEWGFRRLTLAVDSRVLVPRPETEVVVERCLALLWGVEAPRALDVGTGSGAIALAIADEHPGARVTAIDASAGALRVARVNRERTGLAVELVRHDLFSGLPEGPWNLVVSNPPYVASDEIESLEPEVRDWEPRQALVGEGATEAIVASARDVLVPGGAVVLECADGDAVRVADLLHGLAYTSVAVTRDLAGRDRVVEGVTTTAVT